MQDDIRDWIAALGWHLEGGELTAIDPIDLGYGTGSLPAEVTIAIMLADLDGCDDPSVGAGGKHRDLALRQSLLEDFRRLRELIG